MCQAMRKNVLSIFVDDINLKSNLWGLQQMAIGGGVAGGCEEGDQGGHRPSDIHVLRSLTSFKFWQSCKVGQYQLCAW